jgi:hypothetical protein
MSTPAITDEIRTALNARQSALLAYEGSRRDVRAALERYLRTLAPEGITIDVRIDDADRDAVRVTATVIIFGQTTSPPWLVHYDRKTDEVMFMGRFPTSNGRGRLRGMKAENALAHLVATGDLEPVTGTDSGAEEPRA